jgi:hypothetical protein
MLRREENEGKGSRGEEATVRKGDAKECGESLFPDVCAATFEDSKLWKACEISLQLSSHARNSDHTNNGGVERFQHSTAADPSSPCRRHPIIAGNLIRGLGFPSIAGSITRPRTRYTKCASSGACGTPFGQCGFEYGACTSQVARYRRCRRTVEQRR